MREAKTSSVWNTLKQNKWFIIFLIILVFLPSCSEKGSSETLAGKSFGFPFEIISLNAHNKVLDARFLDFSDYNVESGRQPRCVKSARGQPVEYCDENLLYGFFANLGQVSLLSLLINTAIIFGMGILLFKKWQNLFNRAKIFFIVFTAIALLKIISVITLTPGQLMFLGVPEFMIGGLLGKILLVFVPKSEIMISFVWKTASLLMIAILSLIVCLPVLLFRKIAKRLHKNMS